MTLMVLIPVAVMVIVFLVLMFLKGQPAQAVREYRKAVFLSAAEKDFLRALDSAVGSKYRVFSKVRLADIISPLPGDKWQSRFNRISAKHVDFLLCGLTNGEPSCAIELDDRTHTANSRVERDDFLSHALQSAGVPIARFQVSRNYVGAEIMAGVEAVVMKAPQTVAVSKTAQAPGCPKCGKHMVLRKAQAGPNAGHSFWGCSSYPQCKGIVSLG